MKQVPEVAELALDPATGRLRRDGVPLAINPFDRRALLEALRLKAEIGATVVALSMGPPAAEAALRECLGLGVDRAVHLCDARFAGSDTLATARTLARAIAEIGADLVLAGRYSIDAETGQVAPQLAEFLEATFLGGVRRMALVDAAGAPLEAASLPGGGAASEAGPVGARLGESAAPPVAGAPKLRVECENDDGSVALEAELPAVVSCTDRWRTRVPLVLPDDDRAASAPVERWTVESLGGAASEYGQAGSPTWVSEVRPVEVSRTRRIVDARGNPDEGVRAAVELVRQILAENAESTRGRVPDHRRIADPYGAVWVVAERAPSGALRTSASELLGAADELAGQLATGVAALVVESLPDDLLRPLRAPAVDSASADSIAAFAADLGCLGADVLLHPSDRLAIPPDEFTPLLVMALIALRPRIVLAPASSLGRDIMPRLAAQMRLGLTGDAIGVELSPDGELLQLKPAFGGQVVAPILSRTRPEMTTIRPGMLDPVRPDGLRPPARPFKLDGPFLDWKAPRWISFESEVDPEAAALDAARSVVCAGFGLGREGVPDAVALARRMGGATGATRRVCDLGWLPRQAQIGISGRSVAPALYLALGVRGSFNHMVGVGRAGAIIAVNRDPEAEVFAGCDLGVVGDARDFARSLRAALEAH